jgi:hypothetical protein
MVHQDQEVFKVKREMLVQRVQMDLQVLEVCRVSVEYRDYVERLANKGWQDRLEIQDHREYKD